MAKNIRKRCSAFTEADVRCDQEAIPGSEFCQIHSNKVSLDKQSKMRHEYDKIFPVVSKFASTLEDQLYKLLISNDLTLGVPIEYRVKTWPSIIEKHKRKSLELDKFQQLDDLVGLRLILLFKRDLKGIHDLLYNTFNIISYEDTSIRLEETQFGYQSVHYIISIPEKWCSVPTLGDFKGLIAELQVRTLSQHIWAAASHKLQYKKESSVPLQLRRSIHRVSAILETVDLEFERLLNERDSYVKEIETIDEDRDLNVDVTLQILESKWPPQNFKRGEDLSELVSELKKLGIETSSSLENLIDENYEQVMKEEKRTVADSLKKLKEDGSVTGTTEERTNLGVYYTFGGLTRTAFDKSFGSDWRTKVKED